MKFVPIIICGGSGTRLWPRSRVTLPKPFIILPGQQRRLIDETYTRLTGDGLPPPTAVITVVAAENAWRAQDSYAGYGPAAPHLVIGEPLARNTAPAIAVATAAARQRWGEDVVLAVLPADHLIQNPAAWRRALALAANSAAGNNAITLLGISPTRPAVEYGYIECGKQLADSHYRVRRFVEKPDLQKAEQFLAGETTFLWNAGMFCFRAATGLAEFEKNAPNIAAPLATALAGGDSGDILMPPESAYSRFPAISFDYAVMEKTAAAEVVAAGALEWSDVGSWAAVGATLPADDAGNRSTGDTRLFDCQNCLMLGDKRLIVGVGLSDVQIVDTPDALLVATGAAAKVGAAFTALANEGRAETTTPATVPKPWGTYTVITEGENYKVKRINVNPGAKLSLQSHKQRSEHWTVIAGVMSVTIDDNKTDLSVNESCHIPCGAKHRMENNGNTPAALIEVQIGAYLGEDDIVRYEDIYGRVSDAATAATNIEPS